MVWRNCVASITLAREINERWPKRDKASDGTIGDAAHASRNSDHNPWVKDQNGVGVVRARDIDEDLDGDPKDSGADAKALFDRLLSLGKVGDARLKDGYLIYEGKIYSRKNNWSPRDYSGLNAHKKHIHVSFSKDPRGYDSNAGWGLLLPTVKRESYSVGDTGNNIKLLQALLNILSPYRINSAGKTPGDRIKEDGVFSSKTREAVAEFQRFLVVMWRLSGSKGTSPKVDGIAGPQTLSAIMFWIPVVQQNNKK